MWRGGGGGSRGGRGDHRSGTVSRHGAVGHRGEGERGAVGVELGSTFLLVMGLLNRRTC